MIHMSYLFLWQIPFSLTIELWGEGDSDENQCFDLFNPTSEKLQVSKMMICVLNEFNFSYEGWMGGKGSAKGVSFMVGYFLSTLLTLNKCLLNRHMNRLITMLHR